MEHRPDPVLVPVPGGKRITEHTGAASTGDRALSVAHMVAPAGWSEPAQTPEFDELTLVLRGVVRVHGDGDGDGVDVRAGESVRTAAGERVRYEVPADAGETEYVAVCTPAFDPALVHREDVHREEAS